MSVPMSVPEVQQGVSETDILFPQGFHNPHLVSTCYTHNFNVPTFGLSPTLGPANLENS